MAVYDKSGNELTVNKNNIYVAENPSFVGSPVTIFENDDETAVSGVDNVLLNTVSVIKISDSLYYMYYEGFGSNFQYTDISLCFAYSTDGESFIKGFPSGVEAPISGTNRLLPKGSTHGQCVVRVPDSNYPFRMITIKATDPNRIAQLWKSADGINWTLVRQLTNGYNDSPVSCVVRGNLLKIFVRNRINNVRSIAVITTDLDGNRHGETYDYEIQSDDANNQLYQASASILDDKREILLPTVYNASTSAETITCLLLEGGCIDKKAINYSAVMPVDVKSIYFGSGIVDIGRKTYAFYATRDTDHDHSVVGTTKSAIRRIEVSVSP